MQKQCEGEAKASNGGLQHTTKNINNTNHL